MAMTQTVGIPATFINNDPVELHAEMRPDASVRLIIPGIGSVVLDRSASAILCNWLACSARVATIMRKRLADDAKLAQLAAAIKELDPEDVTETGS